MAQTLSTAIRSAREDAGLSLRKLAREVPCSHGYLSEVEAGTRTPTGEFLRALDVALAAGGTIAALAPRDAGAITLVSHKFVVNHVAGDARAVAGQLGAEPEVRGASMHWRAPAEHPEGDCTVHVWAHGVVIHHLVQERTWPTLVDMAMWRYATYPADMAWASARLEQIVGRPVDDGAYVLSLYEVLEAGWSGDRLDTALRLLCTPRTLVGDASHRPAPDVEPRLLREGIDSPDLTPFSVPGASIGWASWSGIVHHPLDEDRALPVSSLVDVELDVQAMWAHCAWLATQVQAGGDPDVGDDFTWRWLRAARSSLSAPRPVETGPHRSMREAILVTSGVVPMLDDAIATLKESL